MRLIREDDADDLLQVYSDKNALPFFNGDNCNGSNFYCAVREDMENTIKYWLIGHYQNIAYYDYWVIEKEED